jgi:CheY-like chemotaxis protein
VKKRILIVDDTRTVLMVEKLMLAGQNCELDTASNGREGLEKAKSYRPDLILLDIIMPEMDGIEACRRLKSDPDTKDITVIMVTTKGEPERVEQALIAGCDDYITKPIDKFELTSKVTKYLSKG